ncbi:putative nuclease HARBI1 [Rhipicephalus sanguineus]|uniref:putative nuclease HARBI1 n=1 Tax=Rhipicephalus sanguineus TaxID=34632 RepID=UPI0018944C11|nr:putative nuclease HARBI1 [Rhipicephalus sanguineus]
MADVPSLDCFLEFAFHVRDVSDELASESDATNCVPRHWLRDRLNPLEEYSDTEFLSRFRFTKSTVASLLTSLPLKSSTDNRGQPVPPTLELLIALRFYGAGTFQVVSGDLVNVSQSTVSRVVGRMSRLIASSLFPTVVKFPQTSEECKEAMRKFYEIGGFPGVAGCIDCTHIRIKSPGGPNAEVYRNRKGYFSINVQAITGPQLQFLDVVIGWPGSVHDSRIFDDSRARVLFETERLPGVLLGDAGYACTSFLMTPFSKPGPSNSPEARYQAAHKRTRNTVERAFGIWKRRFPCLHMELQNRLDNTLLIITACAALHNVACMRNEPCPPIISFPATQRPQQPQRHLPLLTPVDTLSGSRARARLTARCFS